MFVCINVWMYVCTYNKHLHVKASGRMSTQRIQKSPRCRSWDRRRRWWWWRHYHEPRVTPSTHTRDMDGASVQLRLLGTKNERSRWMHAMEATNAHVMYVSMYAYANNIRYFWAKIQIPALCYVYPHHTVYYFILYKNWRCVVINVYLFQHINLSVSNR